MIEDAPSVAASARLKLPNNSRFKASEFFPSLGPAFGRWPFNTDTLQPSSSDTFHEVRAGEEYNWPLLSYRLMGSTYRWWLLALVNGYIDAFDGPQVGEILRVPSASSIAALLQTAV